MTLAITSAVNTTVPVTWTTQAGHTATVQMPIGLHAAYASDTHTSTVAQLADTTTGVQPATAVQTGIGTGSTVGLSGGALIGLGIIVFFVARWRHHSKEVKNWFFAGVAATVLVGSWGLFGTISQTVKSTGDSVGNSVGSTIGQQTSVSR